MELNTFYICINENREATVRVEAHDIDEAFDRLNSAYSKDVIELDKLMMQGADMEDITEQIRHNGWYHGRTVDIELPYDRELAEPERGPSQTRRPQIILPKRMDVIRRSRTC